MISRVAEACFWLQRHMERADAMARLLRVNRSFVLDAGIEAERKWYPLLIVSGEDERFDGAHPTEARADGDLVQEHLAWERDNPVSIATAVYWARENARTIREVISLDMWEVLNDLWHWLREGSGRRMYRRDPDAFYRRVSEAAATFHGVCHNTMVHETAFDFMRLGLLLERAGQTARVVDVHHHTFDAARTSTEIALAELQWLALLRTCSAATPYLRKNRGALSGHEVGAFLVLEQTFPRAVLHCLVRAQNFLARVRPGPDRGERSWAMLQDLVSSFEGATAATLHERGIHQVMTAIVDGTSETCEAIHADYFARPSVAAVSTEVAPPA